jgi:hypothetical protein
MNSGIYIVFFVSYVFVLLSILITALISERASSKPSTDRLWFYGLLFVYLLSCGLPPWQAGDANWVPGILCLILIPQVLFVPAWYANPLFFWGLSRLISGKRRNAGWLGVVASLLAISFVFTTSLTRQKTESLAVGFYFWIASMIGLAIAGFLGKNRQEA